MLLELWITLIPVKFFHIIYLWFYTWIYITVNYSGYLQHPAQERALKFIDWERD